MDNLDALLPERFHPPLLLAQLDYSHTLPAWVMEHGTRLILAHQPGSHFAQLLHSVPLI
jgi:hypothetical protein